MSKVTISKHKLNKIETILYAGLSAITVVALMEGVVNDRVIKVRDKTVEDIMKLLTNK